MEHKGLDNIVALHVADARAEMPHLIHVFEGDSRAQILRQILLGVIGTMPGITDNVIKDGAFPHSKMSPMIPRNAGYVIDVTEKLSPVRGYTLVKLTAYRTAVYGEKWACADYARCRGGVLVAYPDARGTGDYRIVKLIGATGIFANLAMPGPCISNGRRFFMEHGATLEPVSAPLPSHIVVAFAKNNGVPAFVLPDGSPTGPGGAGYVYRRIAVNG